MRVTQRIEKTRGRRHSRENSTSEEVTDSEAAEAISLEGKGRVRGGTNCGTEQGKTEPV